MRILLPKGEQKKFIEKILSEISVAEAAKACSFSERTVRDWRREKFLMNKEAMLKLCSKTSVEVPKNFKEKSNFWYAKKGAKIGGTMGSATCINKYGCVGGPNRKKAWEKWWNTKGKFADSQLFKRNIINKPKKDERLAEFIGIMLGDGGFTARGKQIQITLNNVDDRDYINFVYNLTHHLFCIKPKIYKSKNARASKISVSSMELVDYLVKLGLKTGNKVKLQVDVPDWIKKNKSYAIACVRGLMDTDGCIFNHHYQVKNKYYNYKKLSFTCYSQPMRRSVHNILSLLGINSRMFSSRDVRIDSKEHMKKYFKVIGTHNPKHLKRYYK
jgi:hypothetical protein